MEELQSEETVFLPSKGGNKHPSPYRRFCVSLVYYPGKFELSLNWSGWMEMLV
jgi:hypothetical protein